MSTKKTEILKKSKEHRAAFVASQINIGIPFQIRALRKQRQWDQKVLAEKAGMAQPRIALMERPGHGELTLKTLKRLADAYDVALVVRFAPFSELVDWSDKFSPDEFAIPSFSEETGGSSRSPLPARAAAARYLSTAKALFQERLVNVASSPGTYLRGTTAVQAQEIATTQSSGIKLKLVA